MQEHTILLIAQDMYENASFDIKLDLLAKSATGWYNITQTYHASQGEYFQTTFLEKQRH